MTDIAEIMARAMGETMIPGSTTLSVRYLIHPDLIERMALASLTSLQEHGFVVVERADLDKLDAAVEKVRAMYGTSHQNGVF